MANETGHHTNLAAPNIQQSAGSLAHLYMEMIANEGLESWPASRIDASAAAMRFWLLQKGHAENEKVSVEKNISHIVAALKKAISSPQGAWVLAYRPSRQAELSIMTLDENNEPQEHRIDLTFIDEDVRWIIDYKLTATHENITIAANQHKPQLARYASLFSDENRPIKTAVFFLSSGQLIEI